MESPFSWFSVIALSPATEQRVRLDPEPNFRRIRMWTNSEVGGVFLDVLNQAAFLDKLVVGIRGRRKDAPGLAVQVTPSKAIGGKGRKYARKQSGVVTASGNPFDLLYGPMQLMAIIPPLMLTLRSSAAPITVEEITEVLDAICEEKWRASISSLELTFDFTGLPIEFFRRTIFSSAHRCRMIRDEKGWRTYYVGGRTSPWQVRIYQKTEKVVRVEFVLRRPFLRQHGITEIADLERLRNIDLRKLLRLRQLNMAAAKGLELKVAAAELDDVRRRILVRWLKDWPLRKSVPVAKKHFGAAPEELTVESAVDRRLRRMQRALTI
jgi:hypothetical protein